MNVLTMTSLIHGSGKRDVAVLTFVFSLLSVFDGHVYLKRVVVAGQMVAHVTQEATLVGEKVGPVFTAHSETGGTVHGT